MTRKNLFVVLFVVVVFVLFFKAARPAMPSEVFAAYSGAFPVSYQWEGDSSWLVSDPVNVGANFFTGGATIAVPSYQARNQGADIQRDAIVRVAPVSGEMYTCRNGFLTVTCEGKFWYALDQDKILFEAGGHIVRPRPDWTQDTRRAKLTVYKFF